MRKWLGIMITISSTGCQAPSQYHEAQSHWSEPPAPVIPFYEIPEVSPRDWITLSQEHWVYDPKVDIVFVIDNSESMRPAQENLSQNINRFVESLGRWQNLDYRIGVTANWDEYTQKFLDSHPEGPGALIMIPDLGRRYFNKEEAIHRTSLLARTLKIGIKNLADGGPEHEGFLYPAVAALERSKTGDINEGFARPEAQYAVIIVTDADDMSLSFTPESAARKLAEIKGDWRKVSVYGVLVRESDPDSRKDPGLRITPRYHPHCFHRVGNNFERNGRCPNQLGPERILSFIDQANRYLGSPSTIRSRRVFHIHHPRFHENLIEIGSDLAKTTSKMTFDLPRRPALDEQGRNLLRVFVEDPNTGRRVALSQSQFLYFADSNRIEIQELPAGMRRWKVIVEIKPA